MTFQEWKTAHTYIWNPQKEGDGSYFAPVTFRILHRDGNLLIFFKCFIHTDLQTLLFSALLFSQAALGITRTLQNLDLMWLWWFELKCKQWLDHGKDTILLTYYQSLLRLASASVYMTEKQRQCCSVYVQLLLTRRWQTPELPASTSYHLLTIVLIVPSAFRGL